MNPFLMDIVMKVVVILLIVLSVIVTVLFSWLCLYSLGLVQLPNFI